MLLDTMRHPYEKLYSIGDEMQHIKNGNTVLENGNTAGQKGTSARQKGNTPERCAKKA